MPMRRWCGRRARRASWLGMVGRSRRGGWGDLSVRGGRGRGRAVLGRRGCRWGGPRPMGCRWPAAASGHGRCRAGSLGAFAVGSAASPRGGATADEVGHRVGAVTVVALSSPGGAGGGEDPFGLRGEVGLHLGADMRLEAARQGPEALAVDAPPGPAAPPQPISTGPVVLPGGLGVGGLLLQIVVGPALVLRGVQQLLLSGGVLVGRVGDDVGLVLADLTVGQRVSGAVSAVVEIPGGAGPAPGLPAVVPNVAAYQSSKDRNPCRCQ